MLQISSAFFLPQRLFGSSILRSNSILRGSVILRDSSKLRSTPEDLLAAAEKLREEAAIFENDKAETAAAVKAQRDERARENDLYQQKWTVNLPILKQDGRTIDEDVPFKPLLSDGNNSTLLRCEVPLPMGVILGESTVNNRLFTTVDEIADDSPAVGILQIGDILRATTATQRQMATPTWQLLVGGIGQPKTVRFMFATDSTRSNFGEVMDAVKSNRDDPQGRPAVLVVERLE